MSYPLVGSYPAAGYGAPHPAVYGAPPPAGGWYPPPVDYGMRPAGYGVPPGQAPPPAGYPAQPPAGPDPYAQPSPGGYAQQPPPAGSYPPQQLALTTPGSEQPQPAPGSYPRQPPAGSYPPQQPPAGGYPPQQPPASSYPPQHPPASGHPQQPAASSYPQQPPAAGYPQQPPASGYPQQPPASGYPQQPPASGYPQQPPAGAYGQPPPGGGYPAGGYDPYAAAAAGYAAPAGYGFYPQPAGYPGYPPPAGYGYYPPGYYPPGGAYGYPPPGDDRDRRDRSDSRSRERSPRGRKRGGRRGGRGNQEESRQDGGNDDRERRVTRRPADPGCNICVFRIPPDWDEAELQRHFDHFGDVVSCTVVKNPEDGQSKGFGFVGFAEKDAVRRSIMGMDGLPVGHHYENPQKTLSVSPKKGEEAFLTAFPDCYPPAGTYGIEPPNTRAPPGGNLYVYNIPLDWKDINLYRHFIHYGELASVKVMMKEGNEEGRGFGFVGFISPVAAQRAVSGMNGFRLSKDDPGKKLQVTVKRGEEAAASAVKKQISYRDPADPNYGRDTPEEAAAKEAARRLVDTTH